MNVIKAYYSSTVYSSREKEHDRGCRIYTYTNVESADGTLDIGEKFKAAGLYMPAAPDVEFTLYGEWTDGKNGKMFKVESFDEILPTGQKGITEYLSAAILGITPEIADKIYRKFKERTFAVLDEHPEEMYKIKYDDYDALLKCVEHYTRERCMLPVILFLNKYFVSQEIAAYSYQKLGRAKALQNIKKDPYQLIELGVKLQVCKKIAVDLNLPKEHTGLCRAIMLDILMENESTGDIAMEKAKFLQKAQAKVKENREPADNYNRAIMALIQEKKIIGVGDYVYYDRALMAENEVAQRVANLVKYAMPQGCQIDTFKEIAKYEKKHNVALHINQKKAVEVAIKSGISVVTGGPGTGKTTVVRCIREIYENVLHKKMLFLAPTGRAAARMKESSGYDAYTIHKKLKINDQTLYELDTPSIEEDAVVCDEASMLDIYVARKLLSVIKSGHQIIFLGDINQLPSVGVGRVLHDFIGSGKVPTVMLTKVYRQSSSASEIYLNCQKIIKGNLSLEEGDEFRIVYSNSFEDSASKMVELYIEEVKKYGIEEVCCLTPYRQKTASGVNQLNVKIQERINPAAKDKPEVKFKDKTFRLGDRVMNRRNTEDACNGDIGTVISIEKGIVKVQYQFSVVTYYQNDLEYLDLSYAMSIHKSQGSEFKSVICNLLPEHGKMLQMNLFNTAVSRAKKHCIIVGNDKAINEAIKNKDSIHRLSALKQKIRNRCG